MEQAGNRTMRSKAYMTFVRFWRKNNVYPGYYSAHTVHSKRYGINFEKDKAAKKLCMKYKATKKKDPVTLKVQKEGQRHEDYTG